MKLILAKILFYILTTLGLVLLGLAFYLFFGFDWGDDGISRIVGSYFVLFLAFAVLVVPYYMNKWLKIIK